MTSVHKDDEQKSKQQIEKLNLLDSYLQFLAEGGSGRSNTNRLLRAIIDEIHSTKSKTNRPPPSHP